MKTVTKSLIAAGIVATAGAGGLVTANIASAETSSSNTDTPMSSLIDKISSTFNVDKSKVQALFDEEKNSREAEREKMQTERLQKFVDDGTITAAQKSAIEKKIAEMKTERESSREEMKNLTDEERKEKMDEKKTELESWAKEQGLDLAKLKGVLGGGHGGLGGPRR